MARRAKTSRKTPSRPLPPRDPIAAIAGLDPRLSDAVACLAILHRTRKVFKPRRAV